MHNLKYEIGLAPLNLYTDRPNHYLAQLVDLNIRLFVIGKYEGKVSAPFDRVEVVTPDIKPHLVVSQTKLENFKELSSFASDYKAIFIHYESNFIPNKLLPLHLKKMKELRANLNIFTSPEVANNWDFVQDEACIIPYGYEAKKYAPKVPFVVSSSIPAYEMSVGTIPIVPGTQLNASIIKVGHNGMLYSSEAELAQIINLLNKMDKEDLKNMGNNAIKTVAEKFTKEAFLNSWKKALKNII